MTAVIRVMQLQGYDEAYAVWQATPGLASVTPTRTQKTSSVQRPPLD